MTRNYNQLTSIVKRNKDKLAFFSCMKCLLSFENSVTIQFYLDSATRLPNHAYVSILYARDFYGEINTIELKRENTTQGLRYASVLDTKLIINGELYYHWRVKTNGHYDQQVYWEVLNDNTVQ